MGHARFSLKAIRGYIANLVRMLKADHGNKRIFNC